MRLVLGREPLTEADPSALPAMRRLCEALGAPTHWDDETETLYIKSAFSGRRVRIETGTPAHPLAESLVTVLRHVLTESGAECSSSEPELDLRLDLSAEGDPGVSAVYGWTHGEALRALAASLVGAAAQCSVLPMLEIRPVPGSESPHITLHIRSSALGELRAEPLADALTDTLHTYWVHREVATAITAPWDSASELKRMILDPDPALTPLEPAEDAELAQILGTRTTKGEPNRSPCPAERSQPPSPAPEGRTVPVVTSFRKVSVAHSKDPHRSAVPGHTLAFQRAFPASIPPEACVELPPPGPWRTPSSLPESEPAPEEEEVLEVIQIPRVLVEPEPSDTASSPPTDNSLADFFAHVPPKPPPSVQTAPPPTSRHSNRPTGMAQVITNNGVIIRIQK